MVGEVLARVGLVVPYREAIALVGVAVARTAAPRVTSPHVRATRQCSRSSCARPAVATLTYVYADSTVVVGQLAANAEPHSYDLCVEHAERFTAPRGWDVVHIHQEFVDHGPSQDDLEALANAVREAGRPRQAEPVLPPAPLASEPRRGHLRVVGGNA